MIAAETPRLTAFCMIENGTKTPVMPNATIVAAM